MYTKLNKNKYVKLELDRFIKEKDDKLVLSEDEKCELLFEYCNDNKKFSISCHTTYKNVRIGYWYKNQKKNIKTKDDAMYIKLSKNKYVKSDLDQLFKI